MRSSMAKDAERLGASSALRGKTGVSATLVRRPGPAFAVGVRACSLLFFSFFFFSSSSSSSG